MAFEGLSEKLNSVFKGLRGKGRLTEEDIKLAMREVRMALLEADVSYKVVKDFVAKVIRARRRRRGARQPHPRPAGHQDRQRGADGSDGRRERAA